MKRWSLPSATLACFCALTAGAHADPFLPIPAPQAESTSRDETWQPSTMIAVRPVPEERVHERRSEPPPDLQGVTLAFAVAGDAYRLNGERLRLPRGIEGWEEDIQLGIGVFQPVGRLGHMGIGVGAGEDEDVAVEAHLAMKW